MTQYQQTRTRERTANPEPFADERQHSAIKPIDHEIQMGGKILPIIPRGLDEVWRIAQWIAGAGWAPKGYLKNPRDEHEGYDTTKIALGIMHGLEVGMPPIMALQSITIINRMPTIWGDGAMALVESSGLLVDKEEKLIGEGDAQTAVCLLRRKGRQTPIVQKFSVADARRAGLWQNPSRDPWVKYPQRMLQMRARAWALRDGFADVLRGLKIREEAEDLEFTRQQDGTYAVADRNTAPATPRPASSSARPAEPAPPPAGPDAAGPKAAASGTESDPLSTGSVPPDNAEADGRNYVVFDHVGNVVGDYATADAYARGLLQALDETPKDATAVFLAVNAEEAEHACATLGENDQLARRLLELYHPPEAAAAPPQAAPGERWVVPVPRKAGVDDWPNFGDAYLAMINDHVGTADDLRALVEANGTAVAKAPPSIRQVIMRAVAKKQAELGAEAARS